MLFSATIDGSTVSIQPPSTVKPDLDPTTPDEPSTSTSGANTTGMIFFF